MEETSPMPRSQMSKEEYYLTLPIGRDFFHARRQAVFNLALIFPIYCKFNSKKQT